VVLGPDARAGLRRIPRRHVTQRLRGTLCTNGIGLAARASALARIGPGLTCLISVDGLREDNDLMRGRNTFRHAMAGIKQLLGMKEAGTFVGEVSVSAVLSVGLIARLVEFVEYFDAVGINTRNSRSTSARWTSCCRPTR
jgi:sulfatase maturation enzyme AslB (radical SAM superfamily)